MRNNSLRMITWYIVTKDKEFEVIAIYPNYTTFTYCLN